MRSRKRRAHDVVRTLFIMDVLLSVRGIRRGWRLKQRWWRAYRRKAPRSVRTESKRKDIVVAQTLYGPRDRELESAKEELQRLRMKLGLDRMTFTSKEGSAP